MIKKSTARYPVEPFDQIAPNYDDIVASVDGFPFAGYSDVLDETTRCAKALPGMNILDLGIGTGGLAQRFDAIGCRIWGIDFSAQMLSETKAKLPRAVLLHGDIMAEWPVDFQRRFDRVVSSYTLHHFDLPEKCALLKRVADRFLLQEGLIVVADVSFPAVYERQKARKRLGEEWEDNEFYWACDEAVPALAAVGLRVQYSQVSLYGGVYLIERV